MHAGVLAAYRVFVALAIAAAVATQLAHNVRLSVFVPGNFFGYFTIQSNLFAAAVALYAAAGGPGASPVRLDLIRGAAVLCTSLTGIVFSILLAGIDDGETIGWVNLVLHDLAPLAVVADWLVAPPRTRLSLRQAATWLVLPAAYVLATLARGALVHWYPYPFLDADTLGYGGVLAYIVVLGAGLVAGTVAVVAAGNALRARRRAAM
jgi:hypothetical protein